VGGVRSVIGGDGVHRAVGERGQNGFAVGDRAQRRIHLVIAVVVAHVFIGQREMVRRNLERDARFGALAAAHTLQRVGRGKMGDVQAGIGNVHRELHVTLDDRRFGSRRHAAQSETERTRARVHGAILGHARVFGVLHDREIQLSAQASASRMMLSSRMGLPSSVTAIAPAVCSARKSVSVAPLLDRVAAAMANTLTTAPRSG
jgi:hypothetical protein